MKKRSSTKSHVKDLTKGLHLSLIGRLCAETNDMELPLALTGRNRKRAPIIGTLSFPVIGRVGRALRDNSDIIAEIILRRRPDLLLCAGWSVLSATGSLRSGLRRNGQEPSPCSKLPARRELIGGLRMGNLLRWASSSSLPAKKLIRILAV